MTSINSANLVFCLLVASPQLCSYQAPNRRLNILESTETYKRQFVQDYLQHGAPAEYVPGYPKTSDHNNDFLLLSKSADWVLPMTESQILKWLENPETNSEAIERIVVSIAFTGTPQAIDLIAGITAKFNNLPSSRRWLSLAITSQWDSPADPNGFAKWYYSLDSPHPLVKELAKESICSILTHPLSERHLQNWAVAIVDRHQREPTTLQLMQDPLIEIMSLCNKTNSEAVRLTLARFSTAIYLKRKNESQSKPTKQQ